MTCGDLGVQPGLLDQKLQETFTRAANWNTMVLLDDVDTYVYKRDDCELIRNALLPIFLRHLEYSDCLTFVSMSHLGHVDPSFFSRIQIRIGFPNFDFGTQQKIWHRVMSHLPIDYLDKDELQHFINRELGELDNGWYKEMNGSQIRNCIDVALVLARNEASSSSAYKLQSHHIIRILKLGRDFQDYVSQQATETREHVRQTLFMN